MDKTNKPNIIVILTDDQGYWSLGCTGNREIRTPNIDALAQTGVRFDNFFCASPVCSPARASRARQLFSFSNQTICSRPAGSV